MWVRDGGSAGRGRSGRRSTAAPPRERFHPRPDPSPRRGDVRPRASAWWRQDLPLSPSADLSPTRMDQGGGENPPSRSWAGLFNAIAARRFAGGAGILSAVCASPADRAGLFADTGGKGAALCKMGAITSALGADMAGGIAAGAAEGAAACKSVAAMSAVRPAGGEFDPAGAGIDSPLAALIAAHAGISAARCKSSAADGESPPSG